MESGCAGVDLSDTPEDSRYRRALLHTLTDKQPLRPGYLLRWA
ncbi:MAG TPA: hypothetical protein VGR29_06930 [Thermomicrobiales bacterium]|nr:hypothetical protein [Thermomicrobiales bacterium]